MSLQYKRYVPKDRYPTERNDCTVRALAKAMNLTYDTAHKLMHNTTGRMNGRGASIKLAMECLKIPRIDCEDLKLQIDNGHISAINFPTLAQVMPLLMRGRFVLRMRGHAFAVVDGIQYDMEYQGPRTKILDIYEV